MKGIEKLTADITVDEFVEEYVNIERFEALCQECDNYGKIGIVLLLTLM